MYLELKQDNLGEILEKSERVMVQYGASWCGNCRITKPKFKKLAEENDNIDFVYVDAEKYPNSRQYADVDNLPTFAGFINGHITSQFQGNKIDLIKKVLDDVIKNEISR